MPLKLLYIKFLIQLTKKLLVRCSASGGKSAGKSVKRVRQKEKPASAIADEGRRKGGERR